MQLFEHLITHCKPVHDGSLDLRELDRADLRMSASFVQLRGVGECRVRVVTHELLQCLQLRIGLLQQCLLVFLLPQRSQSAALSSALPA